MRSTVPFVALVAFALVNTAFLGYYLYSSTGLVGSFGPSQEAGATTTFSATTTTVSAQTNTVTYSMTTAAESASSTASSATSTVASGTSGGYVSGTSPSTNTTASQLAVSSSSTSRTSNGSSAFGNEISPLSAASITPRLLGFFEDHSLILAPGSWVAVGGMWIWRGRMRSKWTDLGFDSDVFTLFVKMKGAKTRIRLLDALSVPKDRLQLADELGLDWKSVDRHVAVMKKYGFLEDRVAYGRVKMYQLTPVGVSLLKLLQELSREERRADSAAAPLVEGQA